MKRILSAALLVVMLSTGVPARADYNIGSYCCNAGSGKPFSIDVRNTDIFDVISLIATASGANIVLDGSAKHDSVTLRLQNVSLEQALSTIMDAYGYASHRSGSIITIGPSIAMTRRYGASSTGSRGGGETSRAFTLGHASAQELRDQLERTLPDGTFVIADAKLNRLVVKGSPSAIASAAQVIKQLDQTTLVESGYRNAEFIPLKWLAPNEAIARTRQNFEAGSNVRLIEDARQGGVLVVGDRDAIDLEKLLLSKLDQPGFQVAFDIKVIDLTPLNDQTNLGFLINGGGIGVGAGSGNLSQIKNGQSVVQSGAQTPTTQPSVFTGHGFQLNGALNTLIQRGEATLLATPRVTVSAGQDASLIVGQSSPILAPVNSTTGAQNFTTVDTGTVVKLSVPQMSENVATVKMHLEYSAIAGFVSTFPQIDKRAIDTTETLTDDESIVVAGLYQDFDTNTLTKLPFLGDVPIIGQVFRNRQRTGRRDEIAFIITPHIVRGSLLPILVPAGIPAAATKVGPPVDAPKAPVTPHAVFAKPQTMKVGM